MTPDELALALEEKRAEMLRITRAMLRRSGMDAEAEDFLQDATIKILAGLAEDRYTFAEGVGGLFQTAIINLIHDRRARDHTKERGGNEYTRIYQPDSQAHIRQRERLNLDVALALDKLDGRTEQIVRLVWMEEHTWKQTAKLAKVSERDIQIALDTAKPILQHELARYDHRLRPASIPAEDRCLTSQPAYKKEDDETSESTALQAALFGDGPVETTWPCPPIPEAYGDYQDHSAVPVEEADAA